jgi:hypothetical protein
MYLLKQKHVERTVSSFFLWEKAVSTRLSQRPWQKPFKNPLMFLQLFLAALIVMALAGPYFVSAESADSYTLTLDASMSMTAADVAPSRFERAKEEMKNLVLSSTDKTMFSVIAAGGAPYIAINSSFDKRAVINAIDAIPSEYGAFDFTATEELLKTTSGALYVFSDKSYGFYGAKDVLFGISDENMSVSRVALSMEIDRIIALVTVGNFSNKKLDNSIEIYCDGEFQSVKDVTVEAGGERNVFFTDLPPDATYIEARLAKDDFLLADNSGYAVAAAPRKRKVALITERNVFLENALSLMPSVELYKITPEDAKEITGFYLYVLDGVSLPKTPEDGHVLVFNPQEGAAFLEVKGEIDEPTEITAPIGSSPAPFFDYIRDASFYAAKVKDIVAPKWADEVGSPFILAGRVDERKAAVMAFDLHDTDLPLRKEFPVFIHNVIRYFIPQGGAAGEDDVYCGEPVELNVSPDAVKSRVATPDGEMDVLPSVMYNPRIPGIYTLTQETADGEVYADFAANAAPGDSDITPGPAAENDEVGAAAGRIMTDKSVAFHFIILAFALILAEWLVFTRGN